ncbi:MAG: hypothetical protein ACLR8P_03570 [Clostridium fessum]
MAKEGNSCCSGGEKRDGSSIRSGKGNCTGTCREKKETAVAPVQKKETALAEKKEMAAAAEKRRQT